MYTYVLFAILIISIIVVLQIIGRDFFFPNIIILGVFAFSTIFALIEIDKWEIRISEKTFGIIFAGLSTYTIISVGLFLKDRRRISKIEYAQRGNYQAISTNEIRVVDIDPLLMIVIDILSLLISYKYISDVRNAVGIGRILSFGELAFQYRISSINDKLSQDISSIANHGYNLLYALSFVCVYILLLHIVMKKKKNAIWYLLRALPIGSLFYCSLVSGGRGALLHVAIGGFVVYYLFYRSKKQVEGNFRFRSVVKFLLIGAIVLVAFVQLKDLIGRTTEYNFLEYVAEYIGAPLKNFDTFVLSGRHNTTGIWGVETFTSIIKTIGWFTNNQQLMNLTLYKEFNVVGGLSLGNVYTAFREYYHDFGLTGVVVLSAIHSFLFTKIYIKLRKRTIDQFYDKIDRLLLFYSYISIALFYFSIDDRLYVAFTSTSNIEIIILILALGKVLPKYKFVFASERINQID